jgi:prepilin-type N-terminal cleavage/methylation domain-containing protein
MNMRKQHQRGFSLLELMVAMMIIGVLATLGFKGYQSFASDARYTKARDRVRIMSEGLDHYYIKHGRYPELGSWDAMIAPDSPLVKESLIAPNMDLKDPWEQSFEATSAKGDYTVRCIGDPTNQEKRGPIEYKPGRMQGSDNTGAKPAGEGSQK